MCHSCDLCATLVCDLCVTLLHDAGSGGTGAGGLGPGGAVNRRETADSLTRAAAAVADECLKGAGQVFEHLAFVASHR